MELTLGTWRVSVERTAPEAVELAAMYDAAAHRWHHSIERLGYSRAYSKLFGRLFSDGTLVHLEDGGRVLDCGVGTGALSLGLAEQAPVPLRIEGVDVSDRMLDQARRNLGDAAVDVRLQIADVRSLPYEDASFDAVVCAHVLEHLDDPLEGISEMVRVLRPGGVLVVVATRRSFSDELLRLWWRYTSFEQEQLVGTLEEAGLDRVRCYPLSGGRLPRSGSTAAVGMRGSV
ncbi:MAG: methyltransferase domain-containing protein [Rubrobacteraceae bacterium]